MATSLTVRQKIIVAICGLLVFGALHVVMVKTVSHQAKAIILRGEFVLAMETILTLMSVMIWQTFAPFLKSCARFNTLPSNTSMNGSFGVEKNTSHNSQGFSEQTTHVRKGVTFLQLVLLVYLLLCQFSYLTNLYFISKEPHWFAMLAYICLGSYIQLVTSLVIGKVMCFIINMVSHNAIQRQRGSGKKIVVIMSIFYTLFATMLGFYTASQPPAVRHVKIPVRDLPSNLDGVSVVQISDIHLGPTVGFTKLNMIVDIVNRQNPDMVLFTGDMVDGRVASLKRAAEPLSRVISKHGNFFVTGNHEYYTGDVDNWLSYVRSLGFTVLHNSNVKIPVKVKSNEGQLCLAGTDDVQADAIGYDGHGFDIAAATDGCAKDEPVILLAHQPRAAKMALDSDHRVDVVLSGHTHGGQIFPLTLGAYLLNPFYRGLYQYGPDGSHVYVCEGTQYWGIPMRIGTSTEITHITFTKAPL